MPERTAHTGGLRFDEIGYWTEIKLDIVKDYAKEYSKILSKQECIKYAYIDGFAGSGVHLARDSRELVAGSPLNALKIDPPFHDYFLIDLDGDKVEQLRGFPELQNRPEIHIIQGDCNQILLNEVFPRVKYEDYRRALCVLDPYGLHLNWEVMKTAGQMGTIELFLNFPIMDMNRNALWHRPDLASVEGQGRMTAFWGDDSWRKAAYTQERTLFGEEDVKLDNKRIAGAFRERLKKVAGFGFVPEPVPMKNSTNAVVYYLFFASQKPVASKIVEYIFKKYRNRRG